MYRCLIIADDLTGANATISLLKNLKITTLLDLLYQRLPNPLLNFLKFTFQYG